MMQTRRHCRERGVALLVALFALLLLSAIGLAMMYGADTETSINANYRDKQVAVYASLAGLQEARDRIQPSIGDIPSPHGLPNGSDPNVVYIINPSGTDTVAPWLHSNPYADTELCQENVMGLTGTINIACSGAGSLPSGSGWYTVRDNSSTSYTGAFKLSSPLPYKWTRISLKADNMTGPASAGTFPTWTRGAASNGTQVCWDGTNQIPLPTGHGYDCGPITSVQTITVTNPGTGFTSTPTVTISAPGTGGVQATATPTITTPPSGQVNGVTITNGGASYTTAPIVTFTGGSGNGAAATAVIAATGAPVQSVTLNNAGTPPGCYGGPAAPHVAFTGGGGTSATATATLTGQTCVYGWNVSGTCSGYKGQSNVPVTVVGGGGSGFSGTVSFKNNGKVNGVGITNSGSGYAGTPTSVNLSGCSLSILSWVLGYQVASLTLTNGGAGYTSPPAVNIDPAPQPSGALAPTATATLAPFATNAGQVVAVNITSSGSGYTTPPVVTFTGDGTGAAATAAISSPGGTVTAITVTNHGSGYTGQPTVTITGGGGTGATAKATMSGGSYLGQVYMLTSMAQTRSGARAMSQMEVVTPVRGIATTGALTIDGPNPYTGLPLYSSPNSQNFYISGNDANSCGEPTEAAHPAVGTYDDPNNPTPTSAQDAVIDSLARPDHYYSGDPPHSPDVQNVFNSLGEDMSTPTGLAAIMNTVASIADHNYGNNPGSIATGTAANPVVNFVDGNLDISGNFTGYGILAVTGSLSFSGNFTWNGVVFVIGTGVTNMNGGGNGLITGTVFVAKIAPASNYLSTGNLLPSLGSPTVNWNGGGGNGIQYDHCWADNMLARIPYVPPQSAKPLKVLSVRTVTY